MCILLVPRSKKITSIQSIKTKRYHTFGKIKKSKLQVLSFTFTPNCKRCPLAQKLTGSVLFVSKSYMLCPLGQTQLDFFG
ncbi:hypothetical protein Hanom_Chr01g00067451 [Helianthus anomalus]